MNNASNLINIYPTNTIQVLNLHEILWRFCLCPSNNIFDIIKKIDVVTWAPHQYRKNSGDKANIGNPEVNIGCPPLTANRISTDCDQNSPGPSIHYIPLGVYHARGFNVMHRDMNNYDTVWIKQHVRILRQLLCTEVGQTWSKEQFHTEHRCFGK